MRQPESVYQRRFRERLKELPPRACPASAHPLPRAQGAEANRRRDRRVKLVVPGQSFSEWLGAMSPPPIKVNVFSDPAREALRR